MTTVPAIFVRASWNSSQVMSVSSDVAGTASGVDLPLGGKRHCGVGGSGSGGRAPWTASPSAAAPVVVLERVMSKCRPCRWRDALAAAAYGLKAAAAYGREMGGGRFSRGRRSDDWPMFTTPFPLSTFEYRMCAVWHFRLNSLSGRYLLSHYIYFIRSVCLLG